MTGYMTNLMYDTSASMQELAQATKRFREYDFLVEKYENRKSTNTVATCDGKFAHIECNACKANDGLMDNTRKASLEFRLNVEGDLFGLTRPFTLADNGKYVPCNFKNDNSCAQNKPISQPRVCDRAVAPTNMKPYSSPFTY